MLVQHPPSWTYFRSCVWFLQELLIFAIGARVFWKRPDDDSAQLFFAVCIVTVGAFMGGYHWTEIVAEPLLIYPFALFAVFVPVVNLHFYLVFPRANPILAAASPVGPGRRSTASRRPTWSRSGGACARRAGWHCNKATRGRRLAFQRGPRPGAGLHRAGGVALRAVHPLPGLQLPATRGRGPSGTRSSGSCWPR